jgi:hypothetical protein
MPNQYFIGVDLGQRRDRTAIAILERSESVADRPDPVTWARPRITLQQLRHIERMPQGTPYTVVVQRVARIAGKLAALGSCTVAVDATGVGLPVVDSLRIPAVAWRLMPVTIVYADRENYCDGFWRVPKRDLIASLQLAFDASEFTIARDCKDTPVLIEELTAMRANRRPTGAVQYASPGAAHDDLAIALALAWWAAQIRRPAQLGVDKPLLSV